MNENIKISFVIPAYNVGSYIERSLGTILEQDVAEIEIIVVDDGSSDNTLKTCEAFKSAHPELDMKVIRQKNSGVSVARNKGIDEARGKYICFLDADDFYIEKFAERFYELCEENELDIIRGIYSIYDEEKDECKHINRRELSYYGKVLSGRDFLCHSINERANEVVPWLGFFRREFLLDGGFRFPEGIAFEEDQLFFLCCLLDPATRAMQTADDFYAYMVRAGSASKSPSLNRAYDTLKISEAETKVIKDSGLKGELRRCALCYVGSSFYQLTSIYGRVSKADRKTIRRAMRKKKKLQYCLYAGTRHQKIKNFLFQYFPHFVSLVYDIRSKR